MSGSEKSTDAQMNSCDSEQSKTRMSAAVRTDRGHHDVDEPHHSRLRRDTRYRPPREETQKFHLAALLWLSCISMLLVPMATLLDIPIARWCHADLLPQEFSKMLNLSLIYAHGGGIFLIMVAILMMAPTKRWKMPRLATLALGSGAVATLVKMFVLRPRPNSLRLDLATSEHAWIWSFDWTLSRIAEYDAGMRAFPSGYLATATALTVGLWIVVPRGRPLFLAFCVGTMLQRMYCGSHFLSDLFGSAAVGLGWCYICYHPKLIGNVFDKMEAVQPPTRRRGSVEEHSYATSASTQNTTTNPANSPLSAPPAPHFIKDPRPSISSAPDTLATAPDTMATAPGTMATAIPGTQTPPTQHELRQAPQATTAPTNDTVPARQHATQTPKNHPSDGGEPRAA